MTTVAILDSASTIAEATALGLLSADQPDPHGETWFGHTAIFDFAALTVDTLAISATVANLLSSTSLVTVQSGSGAFTDILAQKGLSKTAAGQQALSLPAAQYNLINLGAEPSFLMAFWLTQDEVVGVSNVVAGFIGSTDTASRQWALITRANGGIGLVGLGLAAALEIPPASLTLGIPHLIAIHVERVSSSVSRVAIWVDGIEVASGAGAYPISNPISYAAGAYPALFRTSAGGFGRGWAGCVHRQHVLKVAVGHDMTLWCEAEIEANAARLV